MPELARKMMAELAVWLPDRSFVLCVDGAYATLAGIISRSRWSPRACDVTPHSTRSLRLGVRRLAGQRSGGTSSHPGEAHHRGPRCCRGGTRLAGAQATKLLWSDDVQWYRVCPDALVGCRGQEFSPQRAGRFLLHNRSCYFTGASGGDLRRTLVDRDVLPGGVAGRCRPRASVIERWQALTRRRAIVVALRGDLDLVLADQWTARVPRCSRGARRRPLRRSPTRWPSCAERGGGNEFRPPPVLRSSTS
jgi:hypothetical protein